MSTTEPASHARRVVTLIAIGLLGGFLSGVFGIGGGILIVPLLVLLLHTSQRVASALSLMAVLPAAIVGALSYGAVGDIDVIAAALIASGGIIGALIGTWLLRRIPLSWLRWLFIAFLVLVAVRMLLDLPDDSAPLDFNAGTVLALIAVGLAVGTASGLFGIGGGVIFVPALVGLFGITELIAKGTSLLAMIPTSITGSIANMRARLVRARDGITLGVSAALAAYPGTVVAHLLPTRLSHILFAALVLVAAAQLALRAVRDGRKS